MNLLTPLLDTQAHRLPTRQQSFQSRLHALYQWSYTNVHYTSSNGDLVAFRVACNILYNRRRDRYSVLLNNGDVRLWLHLPRVYYTQPFNLLPHQERTLLNLALNLHLEHTITFIGTSGRMWDERIKYLHRRFYIGHIIPLSNDPGHTIVRDYSMSHKELMLQHTVVDTY